MMLRRSMTEIVHNRENKEYTLRLECGHDVKRRDSGQRRPPKSTYCDECVIVLERLERAEGWATAKQVKSSIPVLRYLEREGLVECSQGYHEQTKYWKRRKGV